MSQASNTNFMANPLGYAQVTPILGFDQEIAAGPLGGVNALRFTERSPDNFYTVRGAARFAAIDLDDAPGIAGAKRLVARLVLAARNAAIAGNQFFSAYYLPWSKDRTFRTTLKPRSQFTAMGLPKHEVILELLPPSVYAGQDSNDPDYFFTSAVNGCMVVIEGSREQPTVYHSNAFSTAGSPLALATTPHHTLAEVQGSINQKVYRMGSQVLGFSGAHAPNLGGHAAVQRKALMQSDYQLLTTWDPATKRNIGRGYEATLTQLVARVALQHGIAKERKKKIRFSTSQGTVFGVRNAGLWTFYYQRLIKYEIFRDVAPFYRGADWRTQSTHWLVVDCNEFWPNGTGTAI